MRALTVWQPWAHGLVMGWKDLENRDWPTPKGAIGEWTAIHAGKHLDLEGVPEFRHMALALNPGLVTGLKLADLPLGAIVGVGRFGASVTGSPSPWFVGEYGWPFSDAVAFSAPIPCKGALGLWAVPDALMPEVRAQFRAARQTAAVAPGATFGAGGGR